MIQRALISVYEKRELEDIGAFLFQRGVEILSTGGSAQFLRESGIKVTDVSDYTGFPEIMNGRVKTLHPRIHGAILGVRNDENHAVEMQRHGIFSIDMVITNMYPFQETVRSGSTFEECLENIDIGGPAMIRAAAKNHMHVVPVVDPDDYQELIEDINANSGDVSSSLRRKLAAKAYSHTAAYDAAISNWFSKQIGEAFPGNLILSGRLSKTLRYGENPHQEAAFYSGHILREGVGSAYQTQGKPLSYNNLNDADAAYELIAEFDADVEGPSVAIVKHANPCGVAIGNSLVEACRKAIACDPVSAFGGIVALNCAIDEDTANEISELFLEVIVAPGATEKAQRILEKKASLRLLLTGSTPDPTVKELTIRSLAGGYLLQTRDNLVADVKFQVPTVKEPTKRELKDLLFAFTVAKHVKSNAIVYAKNLSTVGIGAGQMSRVDSARLAVSKAEEVARARGQDIPDTRGSVAASDAFFPFPDGMLAAAEAGITAVIQPGGSIRDNLVIEAADKAGISMVLTGVRHFKH